MAEGAEGLGRLGMRLGDMLCCPPCTPWPPHHIRGLIVPEPLISPPAPPPISLPLFPVNVFPSLGLPTRTLSLSELPTFTGAFPDDVSSDSVSHSFYKGFLITRVQNIEMNELRSLPLRH